MDELPAGLNPSADPGDLAELFAQLSPEQAAAIAAMMAGNNADSNRWAVDLLAVAPHDRVLEVGAGPGMGVGLLAARATGGLVAGIDVSAAMVEQARARNADLVRTGRAQLLVAPAERIPFPDGAFTKALAVHVAQFWPAPEPALREIRRVLAAGGTVVLATRAYRASAGATSAASFGWTPEQADAMASAMRAAGSRGVSMSTAARPAEQLIAVVATR